MNCSLMRLTEDFRKIGIKDGDVLIVHSSLSSMGFVEGGAETVIRALLDVLGEDGTLLFPAFTYREVYTTHTFSITDSAVCIGKIAETFRNMIDVIRSVHPTHSVAAFGKYAEQITRDHELDRTPMGENSPYRKLHLYNAKILMLGCSLNSTSYMHALEEEAELEYCLTPYEVEYTVIGKDGIAATGKYRKHNFTRTSCKLSQKYERCIDVLEEGEHYRKDTIHGADSYLIDSVALRERALLKMKDSPYYFVDLPEGYKPGID